MKLDKANLIKFRNIILNFLEIIFYSSLIGYLMFFLFEYIKEGFVSNYLNINIFLWVCIISGVIVVLLKPKAEAKDSRISRRDYLFIFFLAITCGVIIWLETKEMGYVSYLMALFTVTVVIVISKVLLSSKKN